MPLRARRRESFGGFLGFFSPLLRAEHLKRYDALPLAARAGVPWLRLAPASRTLPLPVRIASLLWWAGRVSVRVPPWGPAQARAAVGRRRGRGEASPGEAAGAGASRDGTARVPSDFKLYWRSRGRPRAGRRTVTSLPAVARSLSGGAAAGGGRRGGSFVWGGAARRAPRRPSGPPPSPLRSPAGTPVRLSPPPSRPARSSFGAGPPAGAVRPAQACRPAARGRGTGVRRSAAPGGAAVGKGPRGGGGSALGLFTGVPRPPPTFARVRRCYLTPRCSASRAAGRGAGWAGSGRRSAHPARCGPLCLYLLCALLPYKEKQAAAAPGRVVEIYPFVYITISSIFLPSKQRAFRHLGQIFIPKSVRRF